ncbi:hypothetical protein P389DRAFT_33741 [Cystobasidium minutum MCA 4210]|uniref:uncharacterized protein n=1 Tax=Cystobasidium minutum MCA 4210 TaxID=1397322 RepID=UPI0034CE4874|eukprot:jgi/Rhomi1/33741/CE33740_892
MASISRGSKQDDALSAQLTREPEDSLKRIYELKSLSQQQQDPKTTEDTISELIDTITAASSTSVLLRAAYGTLIAILSNVHAKSLSNTTINRLYKLTAGTQREAGDEHGLSRLKIVDLTIAKSSQKPDKHDLEAIVRSLAKACFTGAREPTETSISRHYAAPSARIQAVPNGKMGHFAIEKPSVSSRRVANRKSSTASLKSHRSSRSSAASGSESSDTDSGRARLQDSAAIRLEGLRVLSALAKLDTRDLHPFWPLFLGPSAKPSLFTLAQSDLSLVVRLQAIQTIKSLLIGSKGYLDLARESKTKLAFTPLSQTLADIANDINVQTVQLLRICFSLIQATEMMIAALQLTSVVIANSPYERLGQAHLAAIVQTILQQLPRIQQTACLTAATIAFKAAARCCYKGTENNYITKALQETFARAMLAGESSDDGSSEEALWLLIASLARLSAANAHEEPVEHRIIEHIVRTFGMSGNMVQSAYIEVLAAFSKATNRDLVNNGLKTLLTSCGDIRAPSVRVELASLAYQNLDILEGSLGELVDVATSLADVQQSKDVRSRALRIIGGLLQLDSMTQHFTLAKQCFSGLEKNVSPDAPLALRAEATWNLANAMDGPNMHILSEKEQESMLRAVMAQTMIEGASRDAEMVRTSSIRIVGALLSRLTILKLEVQDAARMALIKPLLQVSAKVQWNAATAITKLIQAGRGDLQAVTALLTTLKTSKNVKVRKSIVHALEALETQTPNFAETVEDELEQVSVQPDEKGQDLPYDQLVKSNALDESVRQLLSRIRSKRLEDT